MIEKFAMMALMMTGGRRERTERGATATEYGLLVGLIALIIVAGVGLFGENLNTFFNDLAGTVATW